MQTTKSNQRNPQVIIGAIRETLNAHRHVDCHCVGFHVERLHELVAEMEEALNVQQLEMSLKLVSRPESAVRNDSASAAGERPSGRSFNGGTR